MTRSLSAHSLAMLCCVILAHTASGSDISISFHKIIVKYCPQKDKDELVFGGTGYAPIPADFFGPGSVAFSGPIQLTGLTGGADVELHRHSGANFGSPPASQSIPIGLQAASTKSEAPILVTYNNGTPASF